MAKGTDWVKVLQVLTVYRLPDPGSEWRLHRDGFGQTALADLLGGDFALAAKDTLYRCHDRLRPHKKALFTHLANRWRDLFNADWHQPEGRIEAHIFISFLAYCLHVTLRARRKVLAPGLTPRAVFEKMANVHRYPSARLRAARGFRLPCPGGQGADGACDFRKTLV